MRVTLKAALLCLTLLGFGVTTIDGAQAVEKAKKPVSQKVQTKSKAGKSASAAVSDARVGKSSVSSHKKRSTSVSVGSVLQLHDLRTPAIQSGSALVVDQVGGEALFQKNASVIAPIASITKVMTAMVVLDSTPNMQAPITIADDDVDYLRGSRSRLHVGAVLKRESALLLALMSSENRAAHALARTYPGGMSAFLDAMNIKAQALGMRDTRFEDPTGLTSRNVSTAQDLAKMVAAAYRYPLIREFTTTSEATVEVGGRELAFHNTNPLVKSAAWDVGLSKTGYIQEAGKCLVMQARVADKPVVIVLLDSIGKLTRVGDANRIKRWMESAQASHRQPAQASLVPEITRRPG